MKNTFDTSPHVIEKPIAKPTLVRQGSKGDVHFHHKNYAQQGSNPQELLAAMDQMHMAYTVLAPIPTNLLVQCGSCDALGHMPTLTVDQQLAIDRYWNGGRWSKELWAEFNPVKGSASLDIHDIPNYYISDMKVRKAFMVDEATYKELIKTDGPLYYNTMVDDQTADAYTAVKPEDRHRFDPMVTGLPLGDMRSSEMLIDKLRRHKGVFTGVGEITVYKEWVQEKVGIALQADMTNRACALIKLMNTCGVIGMPVVLHCDIDVMPWDRKYFELAHFRNICNFLKQPECRNTHIIWAHAGGLGKYSRIRDGHLGRLEQVLQDPEMAHVYFDLSWKTVAAQLTMEESGPPENWEKKVDPKKVDDLVKLLSNHPDRFLFGSDALSPNNVEAWQDTELVYLDVFKRLPTQVAEAIKVGNYEKIIVGARQKVRLYEKYCVDYAALACDIRQDNERPEPVKLATQAAIKDAVDYGLQMRAHELDPKSPQPSAEHLKRLVSLSDLRQIATEVLPTGATPWTKVPNFLAYVNRASKL